MALLLHIFRSRHVSFFTLKHIYLRVSFLDMYTYNVLSLLIIFDDPLHTEIARKMERTQKNYVVKKEFTIENNMSFFFDTYKAEKC